MPFFRPRLLMFALTALLAAACGDDDRPGTGVDSGVGGSCTPACTTGQSCCGSRCVNTLTDPGNCGGCGMACGAGQSCTNGSCTGTIVDSGPATDSGPITSMCTPSCSSSQRCCGTECVNRSAPAGVLDARTDSSFLNCNGCGLACDADRASRCGQQPGSSGPPQCLCGNNLQCPAGQACVMGDGGTFLCADLNFDPNNCGEIGNRCNEGESCNSGVCGCGTGAACTDGQACCAGTCTDVTGDSANCGGCGMLCGDNAPSCIDGRCSCGSAGVVCEAVGGGMSPSPIPLPGAGGSLGETCCDGTCVANSDTSCTCGEACTGEDTCQIGGGGLFPGTMMEAATVCCGGPEVVFFGCGGGGLPF